MGSIPTPGTFSAATTPAAGSLMFQAVPFPPGTILWVALGGAVGSALRFGVSEAVRRLPALSHLPWATLIVNVVGSLVIGWFLRWSTETDASPQIRAFIAIGLCGGFTTFSAFAAENLTFLQAGQPGRALLHATASVLLSLAAVFAGYSLARP